MEKSVIWVFVCKVENENSIMLISLKRRRENVNLIEKLFNISTEMDGKRIKNFPSANI
jgi:hypothetical protein